MQLYLRNKENYQLPGLVIKQLFQLGMGYMCHIYSCLRHFKRLSYRQREMERADFIRFWSSDYLIWVNFFF